MLCEALKEAGFPVQHAPDGEKGLQILQTESVCIVLLDIILPGMDGYAFLQAIKADSSTAHIPVFILSNLGQKDEVERATAMGAEAFLVKAELDLSEIVDRVKKLLGTPDTQVSSTPASTPTPTPPLS